jgi:hypothetical protein
MAISTARLQAIEESRKRKLRQDIFINYDSYEITFFCNHDRKYLPSETAKAYHADESQFKGVMGPYGSGKTTFACMDLLIRACKMPKCYDGVRRARTLIFRNTFDQLKKGVYDTWTQWFSDLGQTKFLKGNQLEFHHKFNDGNGIVEWEIWFIPMEKITDPSKFKSFNATNALLNELSELPRTVMDHLVSRLGRYPLKDDIDILTVEENYKKPIILADGTEIERCPYWNGMLADTNPPDTRHYIYKTFEKERPEGFKMFKQPPGLIEQEDGSYIPNKECDNYGIGIGQDYYLKQVVGHTKEYIQVYCMGKYGMYVPGKAVYPQYNDDLHSVERIEFDPTCPFVLALDGGFTPAALFSQIVGGQVRDIKEFTTDRMYLEEFVEFIIMPFIASNLREYKYEVTGDPAITERETAALRKLGFPLIKASTNKIEPRVQAQAKFLNRNIGGQPCYILSREGCEELRAGFIGEYNFKEVKKINAKTGNPEHAEEPDKTHPTSDIHDCAQYRALLFTQNEAQCAIDTDDFSEAHLTSGWN